MERLRAEAAVMERHSDGLERKEKTPEQTSVAQVTHVCVYVCMLESL